MDWLYQQFVANKQKAVVAGIITALIAFLNSNGFTLPESSQQVIESLVWGIVGLVAVYLKRNKA